MIHKCIVILIIFIFRSEFRNLYFLIFTRVKEFNQFSRTSTSAARFLFDVYFTYTRNILALFYQIWSTGHFSMYLWAACEPIQGKHAGLQMNQPWIKPRCLHYTDPSSRERKHRVFRRRSRVLFVHQTNHLPKVVCFLLGAPLPRRRSPNYRARAGSPAWGAARRAEMKPRARVRTG